MTAVEVRARMRGRGIDFDLEVERGEVVAVLGPNGAGKSSLLSLISGLLVPDDGVIRLADRTVTDTTNGTFVPAHDRGVATLSQDPLLFPHMTAEANVAFAPRSAGRSKADARRIAREWLGAVDATALATRKPSQLSGGQAQRIALARALAAEPTVLLLDEPMSALDVGSAPAVRRLIRGLLRQENRTALIVTHDLLDALALADTVVVVDGGRIVERGRVADVLTAPRSTFAARIAGVNLIAGIAVGAGSIRTSWGNTVYGTGTPPNGSSAVAIFGPTAVAVHLTAPNASPRNVLSVRVAEMDVHGATVRIRAEDNPDGSPGIAADVTPAAVAELGLDVGRDVYFVIKSHEIALHPALNSSPV